MKKIIEIDGMHCEHCASKVTTALLEISEIKKAKVNLKKKTAVIVLENNVSDEVIKKKVSAVGFKVINIK